jgi:hypothetical protein
VTRAAAGSKGSKGPLWLAAGPPAARGPRSGARAPGWCEPGPVGHLLGRVNLARMGEAMARRCRMSLVWSCYVRAWVRSPGRPCVVGEELGRNTGRSAPRGWRNPCLPASACSGVTRSWLSVVGRRARPSTCTGRDHAGNSCCRSGVQAGDHFCGGREGGIARSCVRRRRDPPDGGCLILPRGGTVETMSPREGGDRRGRRRLIVTEEL